ncbi:hypothetical protein RF55_6769 [Lasius niger]|uniref:Uncharacterized protein n=1 Tax=Lasius niger TaxID=67767 RepID=A0A0J7NL30_LASNI|nr:hypothetical protein RF55_6769 [Lasius niger]
MSGETSFQVAVNDRGESRNRDHDFMPDEEISSDNETVSYRISSEQSLQDNNSTVVPPTTALLLRDTEMPIVLDNGKEKDTKTKDDFADDVANTYGSRTTIKGYA